MSKKTDRLIMNLSVLLVLAMGLFLFIDGFFVHALDFNYNKWNIGFLDSYINHAYIGIVFIAIAIYALYRSRR